MGQGLLRFGKQQKLLKRAEFLRCYNGGKRHHTPNFLFFVLPTQADTWRFGTAVSRKVGGAVQRNRVKRLLREFFRQHQSELPQGLDIVAVPKKGLKPCSLTYAELEKELLPLLTGLSKHYGPKSGL